ncbi:MAG: efflux RND transporter permease subunit [Deltaproteobacteria bacterium]|nr:MAG: efflux RND transporter permease subunit [Deltaproteobacteria bacterium]
MDKIVRINMGAEEGPKATEEPLGDYAGLGGRRRLRPILMTTFTTALALAPMAVGFGEGSEINAPLARVVIGGMLVSALFTMFFVPTLYTSIKGIGK